MKAWGAKTLLKLIFRRGILWRQIISAPPAAENARQVIYIFKLACLFETWHLCDVFAFPIRPVAVVAVLPSGVPVRCPRMSLSMVGNGKAQAQRPKNNPLYMNADALDMWWELITDSSGDDFESYAEGNLNCRASRLRAELLITSWETNNHGARATRAEVVADLPGTWNCIFLFYGYASR